MEYFTHENIFSSDEKISKQFKRLLEAYDIENKWGSLTKLAKKVNRAANVVTGWKTRGIPEEIFSNASLDTGFNKVWLQEGSGQKKEKGTCLSSPGLQQCAKNP